MNPFDQIATKIVKEQELIIGPIAWQEATKVQGLHVIQGNEQISIDNGNGDQVIDRLVGRYEHLFGRASREVCKDVTRSLVANLLPTQVPISLR